MYYLTPVNTIRTFKQRCSQKQNSIICSGKYDDLVKYNLLSCTHISPPLSHLSLPLPPLTILHPPLSNISPPLSQGMEAVQEKGLTRAIGISNFTITKTANLLKTAKIVPAVNQVTSEGVSV